MKENRKLSAGDKDRFAAFCSRIGDEVADEDGFVPLRKLLVRFDANLISRPLLVEGILAKSDDLRADGSPAQRWTVLVDSETYGNGLAGLETESSQAPLQIRLRNTVAHELVHSLAYRHTHVGLRLSRAEGDIENRREMVRHIERATEDLSPLLLLPGKALGRLLDDDRHAVTINELVEFHRRMGISRPVLINRLRLLRRNDPKSFLLRKGLQNMCIGSGEWAENSEAVLNGWPLFMQFDRGVVPEFLIAMDQRGRLPAKSVFPDNRFVLCGGNERVTRFPTMSGAAQEHLKKKMFVECSLEPHAVKKGARFLFIARAVQNNGSNN